MKDTQKIVYKYDLMHRNTPKFARTTITWDTKLMSKLIRSRVVKALKAEPMHLGWGDAGKMYHALREKFEIPKCGVFYTNINGRNNTQGRIIHLEFENATPEIRAEANRLLQAEIAIRRLEGGHWWGPSEITERQNGCTLYNEHDTTTIAHLMREFMDSPEPKRRVNDALQFLDDGGVLVFTYDPTDRF